MKRHRNDKALHALSNPIARAANRARMQRWLTAHTEAIAALQDGQDCDHLLPNMLDELAISLKTIVGWDDPDGLGDVILAAVDAIQAMANDSNRWRVEHLAGISEALRCAVQINCRMPVQNVAEASAWTRRLLAEVRAQG